MSTVRTLYTSGPLDPEHEHYCLNWRREIATLLPGWRILDPSRGKTDLLAARWTPNELRCRDLTDIKRSDVILCKPDCPDPTYPGVGTWGEVAIAGLVWHKPVVLVTSDNRLVNHPWVQSSVARICVDLIEAAEYIRVVWAV